MAITRAQQAKQMLQYGGRIGFKRGNPMNLGFDPKEAAANVGKTSTVGGGGGRDPMAQFKDLPPGYKTSQKNKEALRKQREGMRDSIRDIRRDDFIDTITDFIPIVGTLKKLGKANLSDYYDTKVLPYLQRNRRMDQLTKDEYIRLRTMGAIDAMGRPVNTEDDDDQVFLPGQGIMTQAPGDMDQGAEDETRSALEQALIDRGTPLAFLATGGRVGFKGGADMGTVSTPTRKATAKSVNISPSGNVTTSRTKEPDEVDRSRTTMEQDLTQYLVNQGLSPSEIRKTVKPNLIDRTVSAVQDSRLNNPLTRGIVTAGLYATNPTLAGFKFRDLMKAKNLVDTAITGSLPNTDTDEEDILRSNLITDKQKQIIDKDMKMGDAFDPDATFQSAKIFDDPGETKTLGIFGEDRPAEPMTREEFDAYVRENRAGGGPVGGIMDLESGRQMYFLGKLVKKATRAVKKIVKSPIGKAALFATPFLMSGGSGIFAADGFLRKTLLPKLYTGGKLTGLGKLAIGGALTAAPLFLQEDTNEEDYQRFLRERGAGGRLPAPIADIRDNYQDYMATAFLADGGRPEPVAKKTMPLLDMDGKEMDFRAEGGFVPIGRMERACLLYTSPSPRDLSTSRMPSSA